MTRNPDAPDQAELQAYVDGQLELVDCAEVEAWLATHPDAAAAVMADLQLMSRLRASLAPDGPAPAGLAWAAARLDRARARDRIWRGVVRLLPGAAVVAMVFAAVSGHGPVGSLVASSLPPVFVRSAIAAHDTMQLRAGMKSQPEVPVLDPEELRAATGILLPVFPRDWNVRDVQLFPSADGPGIELSLDAAELGRLTLFSVRPGDFDLAGPVSLAHDKGGISWIRMGETAHVLISDTHSGEALSALAGGLFGTIRERGVPQANP